MWIRSQDKEKLIYCDNLYLEKEKNTYRIICECRSYHYILGTYSTKEKALKVLHMIETHLEFLEYKISDREVIFQMPQDSEVEYCDNLY